MLLFMTGFLPVLAALPIPSDSARKSNSCSPEVSYNSTYPLTPKRNLDDGKISYQIAIISDKDKESRTTDGSWISHYRKGWLKINKEMTEVSILWDEKEELLRSELNYNVRGMELSELVAFNGKLYSCDDRTGVVYEITNSGKVVPFVLLVDGDGKQSRGFKCEWMTVKDQTLWVGGPGMEWLTTKGVVENLNKQWVKSIGPEGNVRHHSWVDVYNKLRKKGGFENPGYMIHEAVTWSDVHKQWFFLPRQASTEMYTEREKERKTTNLLFRADESFSVIELTTIGKLLPTRGYSSFKFVPGTADRIVLALKSEETVEQAATYVTVFDLESGKFLLDETKIDDIKFEGIEFI